MEKFKFRFPLAVCLSEEYRQCYGDISLEQCVSQVKSFRAECNVKNTSVEPTDLDENFSQYSQCLFLRHAGAETVADVKNKCLTQMRLNLRGLDALIKSKY